MITLPDFHDIIHLHRYLQDVPFEVTPSDLYDAGSLYGFDRNNSLNPDWEHTYDKRTYNHYIAQGKLPQDAKEVLARSLHDYCMTKALDTYLKPYDKQQVVGVMGGHNLKRTEPVYRQIVDLSKQLTEQGRLMVTGGGPGAMQATHVGAWMAGRTTAEVDEAMRILQQAPDFQSDEWLSTSFEVMIRFPQEQGYRSLGIPTWFYGHEPASPFATHIAKYFDNSIREDKVLTIPFGGIIFTPGSAGTVQEVFQDAVQNHYLTYGISSPMIFFGVEFWTKDLPVYSFLKDMMESGRYKNLLLTLTDDPQEVVEALNKGPK